MISRATAESRSPSCRLSAASVSARLGPLSYKTSVARTCAIFGDRVRPSFRFRWKETEEQKRSVGSPGKRQGSDCRGWPGDGLHGMARRSRRTHELVAGIGDQRSPRVADQAIAASPSRATIRSRSCFGSVIVVAAHWHFAADVGEQLGGDSRILGEDVVRLTQHLGRAGAEIAEIADRRGHDVETGRKPSFIDWPLNAFN